MNNTTKGANTSYIKESLNRLDQMHDLMGVDVTKIKKFTTLVKDTFDIAVADGLKHAEPLINYDTLNTVRVTDERFGSGIEFELQLDSMMVSCNDVAKQNLNGHTDLLKFINWLNDREDSGMLSIAIDTNIQLRNGTTVPFPQYPFKATPDSYYVNDARDMIFKVDEFVHIHADAPMGRNIVTGDEHVLYLDDGYLVNYRQHTLVHNICEGLEELSDLKIQEYDQFVNFITDELPELRKDRNHARTVSIIDNMMSAFCATYMRYAKEPGWGAGIINAFCAILKRDTTSSGLVNVVSDMMVIGHAGVFKRIYQITKVHRNIQTAEEFEDLLRDYHTLSVADMGAISTFINLPSDLIGACIRKCFGGDELHEYRDYYRTLVWGE